MLTIRNNQFVEGLTMLDFPATRGESVGARATEALVRSPFPSLVRFAEGLTTAGRMVPAEEVSRRSRAVGLNFSEPMPEARLESFIDRKLAERRRQRIVQSGPQDLTTKSLGVFAELATTIVDPINVASAFIPVVGPARFAALTARFGRTGARALRGVAEGLVGAALVEPLVLAASTQEQADYGFLDSLLNVTFGGVLGGGLHVGLGKVGDVRKRGKARRMGEIVSRLERSNREQAFRAALVNVNDGVAPNPRLHIAEDAAVRDLPEGIEPNTPEERLWIKEQNADTRVRDVPQKYQQEVDRVDDPDSLLLADVPGAEEADLRVAEIEARKADAEEMELSMADAEDTLRASARTFVEDADDELLEVMGLTRGVDDTPDLAASAKAIEEVKQQEQAIRALVACMGRG